VCVVVVFFVFLFCSVLVFWLVRVFLVVGLCLLVWLALVGFVWFGLAVFASLACWCVGVTAACFSWFLVVRVFLGCLVCVFFAWLVFAVLLGFVFVWLHDCVAVGFALVFALVLLWR